MNNKSNHKPASTTVKPTNATNRPVINSDSNYLNHGLKPNAPIHKPTSKPAPGPKQK